MKHRALNQLLCAALVSKHFRESLLTDTENAVRNGYQSHDFPLSQEELDFVVQVKAGCFEDFAAQVHNWVMLNDNITHTSSDLRIPFSASVLSEQSSDLEYVDLSPSNSVKAPTKVSF